MNMLSYMQMFRILRWGDYPGLSEWVQCNPSVIIKGGRRVAVRERHDKESRSWNNVDPGAKECKGLLEAWEDKEIDSPLSPPEGTQID